MVKQDLDTRTHEEKMRDVPLSGIDPCYPPGDPRRERSDTTEFDTEWKLLEKLNQYKETER